MLAECTQQIAIATEAANRGRQRLFARTNLLHNAKNPSVTLPSELISTFLRQGLPDWPDEDPFELPQDDSLYLGRITSVCHSWREAARNTPRLWTRMKCSIYGVPDSFTRVRRPLSLSGQLPLAIDIDQDWTPRQRHYDPAVDTPFALINPHIHRLQRLNLTIGSHVYPAIIQLFSGNLLLLSHMSLQICSDFSAKNEVPLPPISPPQSLKYVRLTYEDGSTPIAKHSSVLALNAAFLHVQLLSGRSIDLLEILRNAPIVEELVIQWGWGDDDESEDEDEDNSGGEDEDSSENEGEEDPNLNGNPTGVITRQEKVTLSRLRLLMYATRHFKTLPWIERPAEATFLQVRWGSSTMVPSEHVGTFALEEPYYY